ncbi:MAG: RecX family transcriptional regulator [Alphaproteobacteria bacterium]|nr:RecX family transcriptional regulator [Alphaproteobacteria bacterium]MDE2340266.1 RecX family transcriptional regulator [Alphaproteobacteria bacterium]
MRPIRDKTQKPIDEAILERLALRYVERYATTAARLHTYLARKAYGRAAPDDIAVWADRLSAKMVDLGYVNDAQFAEMRARSLSRRGYGARRVKDALRHAGIGDDDAGAAITRLEITADETAQHYAQRKKIGPYSQKPPTSENRKKALAQLLRAGHDLAIAHAVLASWR